MKFPKTHLYGETLQNDKYHKTSVSFSYIPPYIIVKYCCSHSENNATHITSRKEGSIPE